LADPSLLDLSGQSLVFRRAHEQQHPMLFGLVFWAEWDTMVQLLPVEFSGSMALSIKLYVQERNSAASFDLVVKAYSFLDLSFYFILFYFIFS
jgi:uncharacterized membrane protein YjfL (UPF0719 family)